MARKRLNKKVAIIGSVILMIIVFIAAVLILKIGKDPHKFLADADLALAQNDYEAAERNMKEAYGAARDNDLRIDISFRLADFYLIDDDDPCHPHDPDWRKAAGTWNNVKKLDPKNIQARKLLLNYVYETAKNLTRFEILHLWPDVRTQATELEEILIEKQERELLPNVLLAKGRAAYEIAKSGQTTSQEKDLEEALASLNQAKELDPSNYEIYEYLAKSMYQEGILRAEQGVSNAEIDALEEALEVMDKAIQESPDASSAHMVQLNLQQEMDRIRVDLGELTEEELSSKTQSRITRLTETFPNDSEIFRTTSQYYFQQTPPELDSAIELAQKAIQADPCSVESIITLLGIYFHKYAEEHQDSDFLAAMQLIENALASPYTQETTGPRQVLNKNYRMTLYDLQARCRTEKAFHLLHSGNDEPVSDVTSRLEQSIHELEQLYGTGDNIPIRKWKGVLAYLRDEETEAIRLMYDAYTQSKAAGRMDSYLSYTLARIFRNRPEIGLYQEFLNGALSSRHFRINRRQLVLDYLEAMLRMRAYDQVIASMEFYKNTFSATERSKVILATAYIGTDQFEQAQELIAQLDQETPESLSLRASLLGKKINRSIAELQQQATEQALPGTMPEVNTDSPEIREYRTQQAQLLMELLRQYPEEMPNASVVALGQNMANQGQIRLARELADLYLKQQPENTAAQLLSLLLNEPEPTDISMDRRAQLEKQVILQIQDQAERASALSDFYQREGQLDEARKAIMDAYQTAPDEYGILERVFDIALKSGDTDLAQEVAGRVRHLNLDQCEGNLYAARIGISQGDFQEALRRLNDCLVMRPTLAHLYLLRSQVQQSLDNLTEALNDIQRAVEINPLEGNYAKQYAILLLARNARLGRTVTESQRQEAEKWLVRAMRLNPQDWTIQSEYANFIQDRDPLRALAMRERLRKQYPNISNVLLLGKMAMELAQQEGNERLKEHYLDTAEQAFSDAYQMDPSNQSVQGLYSQYLGITGQQEKVEQLFGQEQDVLWRFYLRQGQYEKARDVLLKLHETESTNPDVLRGLVYVGQKLSDVDMIRKYSTLLLEVDDSLTNKLLRIQAFLDTGLLEDARPELSRLKEMYPDESRVLLLDALATIRAGDLPKGLELTTRLVEQYPDNALAWKIRGQVFSLRNEFNRAVESLQKAYLLEPNPETQIELARAFVRAGRRTEAVNELQNALQNSQTPLVARNMLEQLLRGMGQTEELVDFYEQSIQKYPDSPYWYTRAGEFLTAQGQYEQSIELLKKAWEISQPQGGNLITLDLLLDSLRKNGQTREFYELARKHIDDDFAVIAYSQMAQEKFEQGSKIAAVEHFHKALEKAGTNEQLIYGLLNRMNQTVGPHEVARWCNRKLSEDADSAAANLVMFELSITRGEYHAATDFIDRCIAQASNNQNQWNQYMVKKANALVGAYIKTSNPEYLEMAIAEFTAILDKNPDSPDVMNNLAYLLADNDQELDLAKKYGKRAVESQPNNPNFIDTYAYALIKAGSCQEGEQLLISAIQKFESRGYATSPWEVYYHLGMATECQDRPQQAREHYEKAFEIGGEALNETNAQMLQKAIDRVSI